MFLTFLNTVFLSFIWNSSNSFTDYPLPKQLGFQAPGTKAMSEIIELHHHIMFFLIIILIFTFSMLYYIIIDFTILLHNKYKMFFKIKNLYDVRINHHTVLETIWIIIPTLILLCIAIPSFTILYALDEQPKSFFNLKVTGHQWYWSYEMEFWVEEILNKKKVLCNYNFDSYMVPDNEISKKGLRLLETTCPIILPVKTPIKILVSASDVLHSWAIPSLGIKIDAVPGRVNEVTLLVNRIGRFYGQCSELCGVNHGFMPIEIFVISKQEFINDFLPSASLTYSIFKFKSFLYLNNNEWIDLVTQLFNNKELNKKFNNFEIKFLKESLNYDFFEKNFNEWNNDRWNSILLKTEKKLFNKLLNNYLNK